MSDRQKKSRIFLENDPLWYQDAIVYQLHVRSFFDSNEDGIGDFNGLMQKLDFLRDLGINTLWLLPFCPSPLKDDGYDISKYTDVHAAYGTLKDFKNFLNEAHRRGLRVIAELVLNHTSDQHEWFQRARRAKSNSPYRNFYVWSQDPHKYKDARIIFKDFEGSNWTWDSVANAYFWHRFYSHQPDLNFENPAVQKAMFEVVDFWFKIGVDGLRLDAVPYLFEEEGTNCENLPRTHQYLKALRRHIDQKFQNRMLLAEANQWPEDAVTYFGDGNECHMAFHFPLMPRLFMAIQMENRFPIEDILEQTPVVPDNCQWAIFLRNHDELTLEMVTDEERDYMYRTYAQDPQAKINLGIRRRLAPLLGNNRRKIELMNGLLFSLPGTPVIYYGDEIGMGDNIYLGDRNGVRTPMQWSGDRNAGFSRSNPQKLFLPAIIDPEYHYEAVNVEGQQKNLHSLLWWMKRLLALRKSHKAFGRGTLEFLTSDNHKVLTFIRRWKNEEILVLANLSRFIQGVRLDLRKYEGKNLVELFGQTIFPRIGKLLYFITLAPHSFYWFSIEKIKTERALEPRKRKGPLPLFEVSSSIESLLEEEVRKNLETHLSRYLQEQRWFGGKSYKIRSIKLFDLIPVSHKVFPAGLFLLLVDYFDRDEEVYLFPLAFSWGEGAREIREKYNHLILANIRNSAEQMEGVLYETTGYPSFCNMLFQVIAKRKIYRSSRGVLRGIPLKTFRPLFKKISAPLTPKVMQREQSNTSIVFGESFIMKILRRIESGINPDYEVGKFLADKKFPYTPILVGALEYQEGKKDLKTLALLNQFIPNQGDAWQYTLEHLTHFFEKAMATNQPPPATGEDLLEEAHRPETPQLALELIGHYLASAHRLGEITAHLHNTLASDPSDPAFAPEPFSTLYQRSLYQSMRAMSQGAFQNLSKNLKKLPSEYRAEAQQVLGFQDLVHQRFKLLTRQKIQTLRIRCHGDFHLGQVLYTGKDFLIIDFEGEPSRPLTERKLKRSPLRDVAGMLRSFHYASQASLLNSRLRDAFSKESERPPSLWATYWYYWVSAVFLRSYLAVAAQEGYLPKKKENLKVLLEAFLFEKSVYEMDYELNHRPKWLRIPLQGLIHLLQKSPG